MSNDAFGYEPKLPPEIQSICMELCQEVAHLNHKWHFYLDLFSLSENTDLLSEIAEASFQIIEDSLRCDMTMAICRLSDPKVSMGKENLSFDLLVSKCEPLPTIAAILPELKILLEQFRLESKPIVQYRNKLVGHNDLITIIKPHENPLIGINRPMISNTLELAGKILKLIYGHYAKTDLHFKAFHLGGAKALLCHLKIARDHERDSYLQKINKLNSQ